jgi:hypothetical protein
LIIGKDDRPGSIDPFLINKGWKKKKKSILKKKKSDLHTLTDPFTTDKNEMTIPSLSLKFSRASTTVVLPGLGL